MKKLLIITLCALLLLSMAICANAVMVYSYTDTDSGVCLSLPENWDLEYVDDALIKVIFIPDEDASAMMQYGSSDLWSRLDASKRSTRDEYNNARYTKSDVATLVGCTAKDVRRITIDGTEYYRAAFEKEVVSGKTSLMLDMTFWVRYDNGWVYVYQYVGSVANPLFAQFRQIIADASYITEAEDMPASVPETVPAETEVSEQPAEETATTAATEPTVEATEATEEATDKKSQQKAYEQAVSAYQNGNLEDAEKLFQSVPDWKDSNKYLRLIRIRNAGGNTGMGKGVYQESLALTEAEQKDIDEAAADFKFADTAQVLLCNSDVAVYYLTGLWRGESSSYIYFKTNTYGGTYTIGSKLSTMKHNIFSITNGELSVDLDTPILKMTLTAENTMDVVTYEKDNKTYTLTRK